MRRPLIGITTYGRDVENKFYLPAPYVEAVARAHGTPILLPHSKTVYEEEFGVLDGLVLSGGGDMDPAWYGGDSHEKLYMVDRDRDEHELALARHAVRAKLPTLAICRGAQILNVALGGTLIAHLPDTVGEDVPHRAPPRQPTRHAVRVQPGSRLADLLGQTEIEIASWHHQALRDVSPDLNVVAHAPDGTIEAVELPDHPWLFGVQWHPELTADQDASQQRLFDALVEAAAAYRQKHTHET